MVTAIVRPAYPTRKTKTRAAFQCKCLRCAKPIRKEYEGKTLLICGDEACFLNCDVCTDRPTSGCSFKVIPSVRDEIREEVPV